MSGIHPGVFLAVSRIKVTFGDNIGNPKTILGTGFWIQNGDDAYFVTNRHNVDATLKLGAETKFVVGDVKLQLRAQKPKGNWRPEVSFTTVKNLQESLKLHPSADVAVFRNPSLTSDDPLLGHSTILLGELSTDEFLKDSVNPMDTASFVGFPGSPGQDWSDKKWSLPIARTANIASWPKVAYTNDSIPTTDVLLVSGLSFSGSSGSPVLSHAKGLLGVEGAYVEPKVLGIMSGHWRDKDLKEGMFFHTGLSYFTRATSIRELLGVGPNDVPKKKSTGKAA